MANNEWHFPCGCVDKVEEDTEGWKCTPILFCHIHTPAPHALAICSKPYMREEHPKDTNDAFQSSSDKEETNAPDRSNSR